MFGRSEKRDEKTAERVVDFSEALSDTALLYRTITVLLAVNLAIWIVAIFVPDYFLLLIGLLERLGDKARFIPFSVPFGTGLWLAYSLARLRSPDLEDRKLLDSELMGTIAYNSEANRRYITWLVAIVAGVFNVLGFAWVVHARSEHGLNLF